LAINVIERNYASILVLMSLSLSAFVGCHSNRNQAEGVVKKLTLTQARQQHPTKLVRQSPAPQAFENKLPPTVRRVYYISDGKQLMAWLAMPSSPGPHPAILFSHGGFALSEVDYEEVRPFVAAGFILLMPAYRGENGNPGFFERHFGEVDDALAALDYLSSVPGVDDKRLFIMGHSVGGTIAMLAAEMSPRLRGAAACGAFPDMTSVVKAGMQLNGPEFPFDYTDRNETDLRSPGRFIQDLQCPLHIYNSDHDQLYVRQAMIMESEAKRAGKQVTNETLPNTNHESALAPAVRKAISVFLQE
jgi:dipeptidyl aminopeptidase/acylaminoacyl peptidase